MNPKGAPIIEVTLRDGDYGIYYQRMCEQIEIAKIAIIIRELREYSVKIDQAYKKSFKKRQETKVDDWF